MTKQELITYFGERIGKDVKSKNIIKKGNWIFYQDPSWIHDFPNDVEVYNFPCGSVAECFTEIKKDKSPFNKNLDQKELDEILEDLDNNWHEFNDNEWGKNERV